MADHILLMEGQKAILDLLIDPHRTAYQDNASRVYNKLAQRIEAWRAAENERLQKVSPGSRTKYER
jgi:hypothetical protein